MCSLAQSVSLYLDLFTQDGYCEFNVGLQPYNEQTTGAQTLFLIYIRNGIALRFEPFKRMYENGSKIVLNSSCSKQEAFLSLRLCHFEVFVAAESF